MNHVPEHRSTGSSPPPYVSLKELAKLTGLSRHTLLDYCNLPDGALPCYRRGRGGKIFVKWTVFEAWYQQFETVGPVGVEVLLKAAGFGS